jgi:uncharacterized RDD family membrane protein YckC
MAKALRIVAACILLGISALCLLLGIIWGPTGSFSSPLMGIFLMILLLGLITFAVLYLIDAITSD